MLSFECGNSPRTFPRTIVYPMVQRHSNGVCLLPRVPINFEHRNTDSSREELTIWSHIIPFFGNIEHIREQILDAQTSYDSTSEAVSAMSNHNHHHPRTRRLFPVTRHEFELERTRTACDRWRTVTNIFYERRNAHGSLHYFIVRCAVS